MSRDAPGEPADVMADYAFASIVGNNRVVFNIKGNDYRLVTQIDYARAVVQVRWIGTHAEYDTIEVESI